MPIFAKNTVSKVPIFTKNTVSMMPIFAKTRPIALVINNLPNMIVGMDKMGSKNREKEGENGGKQYYKNCGFASVVHENHIKRYISGENIRTTPSARR